MTEEQLKQMEQDDIEIIEADIYRIELGQKARAAKNPKIEFTVTIEDGSKVYFEIKDFNPYSILSEVEEQQIGRDVEIDGNSDGQELLDEYREPSLNDIEHKNIAAWLFKTKEIWHESCQGGTVKELPEQPVKNHFIKIEGRMQTRTILVNGKMISPERSQKVANHSPDGFNWGYGGSGAAQTALGILLEVVDEEIARSYYQNFKWDIIAELPRQEDFNLEFDLYEWLKKTLNMTENELNQIIL